MSLSYKIVDNVLLFKRHANKETNEMKVSGFIWVPDLKQAVKELKDMFSHGGAFQDYEIQECINEIFGEKLI